MLKLYGQYRSRAALLQTGRTVVADTRGLTPMHPPLNAPHSPLLPAAGPVLRFRCSPEVPVYEKVEEQPEADADIHEWHNGNGEAPDSNSLHALQLAHPCTSQRPMIAQTWEAACLSCASQGCLNHAGPWRIMRCPEACA